MLCLRYMYNVHVCGGSDLLGSFSIRRAFLKRPENFSGPETAPQSSRNDFQVFLNALIFPHKLHGYSLPPEKYFWVCFSCTCLIKWRPPTNFLGQNKWLRSSIKRERVEEGRENNVVRKYGFYQNEFQWLIAVNRQISEH